MPFRSFSILLGLAARCARAACLGLLASLCLCASDLTELARLDGASGDERRVIDYIQKQLAGSHRMGANGSLLAVFGDGSPRTLFIAGVDEPGYAVSAIHAEGYLQVFPLAESPFGANLKSHFLGQPVQVSTQSGAVLPGVVAAPSVHFASIGGSRRRSGPPALFVDIGASSSAEAQAAGVTVLDRVTLEKHPVLLSNDWIAAPWISSRFGVAVLLALGKRLRQHPFEGTVTLAFVTQQYPHYAGLSRSLQSVEADRVVLLASHGNTEAAVAPAPGQGLQLVHELSRLAPKTGIRLKRQAAYTFSFGPFGNTDVWTDSQQFAVLIPSVRHRNTPAEAVSLSDASAVANLLGLLVGIDDIIPSTAEPGSEAVRGRPTHTLRARGVNLLEGNLRLLVNTPGISGQEDKVRELLIELLPKSPNTQVRTDDKGNLIVRLGKNVPPTAIFIAHIDEIGFVVQEISDSGRVSSASRGGANPALFSWRPAVVHTARGILPAVMTRQGDLDFGDIAGGAIRALGVAPGDAVTVPKRFRKLIGKRVSVRSLDDRLGCAVLVEVIGRIRGLASRSSNSVEFVFSVEEETGMRGSRHFASNARPRRVYAIDTFVTSDSPFESRPMAHARLGAGPVLRALDESGLTPTTEVARVLALAKRHKLPLQLGVTVGGNDGSVFRSLESVNIPIGFPLRYAHTPVETADLRDAEAMADLIEALALAELRGRR